MHSPSEQLSHFPFRLKKILFKFDLTIGGYSNSGVGDDVHSWGVDGRRVRRWHYGSNEEWGEAWGVSW
jgi:hypothetical protein